MKKFKKNYYYSFSKFLALQRMSVETERDMNCNRSRRETSVALRV